MTDNLTPSDHERMARIQKILQNPDKPELAEDFFNDINTMLFTSPAFSQILNSNVKYFEIDGRSDIIPEAIDLSCLVPNDTASSFTIKEREFDLPAEPEDTSSDTSSEVEDEMDIVTFDAPESEISMPDLPKVSAVTAVTPPPTSKATIHHIATPTPSTDTAINTTVSKAPKNVDAAKNRKRPNKKRKAPPQKAPKPAENDIPKTVKTSDDLEKKFLERQSKIQTILNDGKGSISSNSV